MAEVPDASKTIELPMFTVTSDPLPMNPAMFRSIGEIVVFWSRIENQIEADIRSMRRHPAVRGLSQRIPHAFSKKLELWRRSVRKLYPSIYAYQAYADAFDEGAQKVASMRNHIIHGTWTLSPDADGAYLVLNHRTVKGKDYCDTVAVSQKVLDDLHADVRMLDSRITGFIASKMIHAHQGLLRATAAP